jgi:lambda family phage portal protein
MSNRKQASAHTNAVSKPFRPQRSVSQYVHQRSARLPTYEAGSTQGRRGIWTSSAGPNSALLGRLDSMRNESRHVIRNNPTARHISDHLVVNVIGDGIRPMTQYPDLYGLQALAFRSMLEGGDSFTRLRARKPEDVDTVPLQLQVLESEHVPSTKSTIYNGNPVVGGIERDLIDRVAAYWMYRVHPTDRVGITGGSDLMEVRVPGEDVIHLFHERRPGQARGEPWLVTGLPILRDVDDISDAVRMQQKVATLFAGFYRKPAADNGLPPNAKGSGDVVFQDVEPGTFAELPPGYDITLADPPDVGSNYETFMRTNLSAIGAAVNSIYEQVTGNWEGMSSDRAYRAAMLEFSRFVSSWQWHLMVFQWCRPVWRRFVSTAIMSGAWTPPQGAKPIDIYRAKWAMPARGYIHPVQEVTAYVEAIKAGFMTREQAAQQLGMSVMEVDHQMAIDKASADQRGHRYTVYNYPD